MTDRAILAARIRDALTASSPLLTPIPHEPVPLEMKLDGVLSLLALETPSTPVRCRAAGVGGNAGARPGA